MHKFMWLEMTSLRDNLLTDDAFEWLTSCMKLIMYLQFTFKRVGLSTVRAGIIIFFTISMSTIIISVYNICLARVLDNIEQINA